VKVSSAPNPPSKTMPNRQARNGAFLIVDAISNDDIDEIDDPRSASCGICGVSCCLTII